MERTTRAVNAALLALLVIATGTGVVAFAVGSPGPARWITGVHAGSGLGLLLLLPAKSRIARRGLRRPGRSRKVTGLALAGLVPAALAGGLLHAFGGWRTYLGLLPMQVHVGASVGVVLLVAAHLRVHRRRVRVRATDVDRRRALQGTGVVAGAAVLGVLVPGVPRRETGSHRLAVLPVTNWLFDPVPRLPPAPRVGVPDLAPDALDLAALPAVTVRALLDCTGGWYSEQEWRGVPVAALGLPPSASIDVVSVTGYRRRFPASEAGSLLLATHVGGRRLTPGNGAPVRLVAPGRRGFWWVKWVERVEVSQEPWWWQPPAPLR